MLTLAPNFGVSDVALKKRCKKLGVPTPPRGYWAKLEAGKKVRKEALPESWTVQKKASKAAQSAEEVDKLSVPDLDYTVIKPLPVIRETAKLANKERPSPEGLLVVQSEGIVRLKVASASLKRALWLWQELLQRLPSQQLTFDPSNCSISNRKESVVLELKEMLGRYETAPTPEERRRRYWPDSNAPITHWIPNGILVFRVVERYTTGRQWKETLQKRLEERLDDVAMGVSNLLRQMHEEAVEAAKQRKFREEESKRQEEIASRRRYEEGRRKRLLNLAGSADKAKTIRNLCDELKHRAPTENGEKLEAFVAWALGYADLIDPAARILRDLDSNKDPARPTSEEL
jgi:hypothetical protein